MSARIRKLLAVQGPVAGWLVTAAAGVVLGIGMILDADSITQGAGVALLVSGGVLVRLAIQTFHEADWPPWGESQPMTSRQLSQQITVAEHFGFNPPQPTGEKLTPLQFPVRSPWKRLVISMAGKVTESGPRGNIWHAIDLAEKIDPATLMHNHPSPRRLFTPKPSKHDTKKILTHAYEVAEHIITNLMPKQQ
jgi:hypothetical protein